MKKEVVQKLFTEKRILECMINLENQVWNLYYQLKIQNKIQRSRLIIIVYSNLKEVKLIIVYKNNNICR
jgi:hypothetical protein